MKETVIRVQHVGKQFHLDRPEGYATLRDTFARTASNALRKLKSAFGSSGPAAESEARTFWALRDISFELQKGEVLGLIGANGAGKSTLLKILSRITGPTEGEIEIIGRVGSLLEVGTGFHHELTGRENVYLSGAVLGMRRAEIVRYFDQIVAFAGIEKFVDTPVKHYSSGMYMRLAFSVAAHLDTEVLMMDEVLAVGDAAFQLKCLNKMSEVSESGRTILFVSHNMEAVTQLCTRALLLHQGRMAQIGTPQECVEEYLAIAKERTPYTGTSISLKDHPGRSRSYNGPVRFSSISILDETNHPTLAVNGGEAVAIALGFELLEEQGHTVTFTITFSNFYNHRLTSCRSHDTYLEPIRVEKDGIVVCRIPRLPFVPGFYRIGLTCDTEAGHSDGLYDAVIVEVVGSKFFPSGLTPNRGHGDVMFDHQWEVQSDPSDQQSSTAPQTIKIDANMKHSLR